ncbi:MAG: DNA polymerase III subunit alpha [Leptospiraceae bacterium]|nr:DNA polymerase III subunit alpha [Leptospiraceae bacterium]
MTTAPGLDRQQHRFTHLHLHTSYSLLDGAIRIPELMRHVKANGMDAVAMTDHGNMFGAIEFYQAAIKEGVKPIIGCEFYVAPGDMREKRNMEAQIQDGGNYHLVLLAQNETGYRNLIKLASRSYTEGFYRKPRIDYNLLAENNAGLICLTACLGGEVQQHILRERHAEAARLAGHLSEVFGKDRFYLEIQKHGLKEEDVVARANLEIARQHNIPLVVTNDSHFLTQSDQQAQEILLRINQKKNINEELFFSFNEHFYVKNPAEMARLFPELPEAMHNTQKINEMVQLDFTFGNPLLPRFDVPEGYNLQSWLYKLAEEGLKRRYNEITPPIRQRFEFEYQVITSMDFPGYFLIVQDFINWAKQNGVPVGPGRGSAAGSIVAYALGITDIDPIRYGLLFERFLNPDRKEMPDIDVDFCAEKREEVIKYVRTKYGADKVGQIITYGRMAAKACLKDVARVLNIGFDEANSISKMFPDKLNIKIGEALETSSELRKYSESGDVQRQLFAVARKLEDNTRHTGIHAAGVVIAPQPLESLVPLATVAKKDENGKTERVPVCQYDMNALTNVGLVKMDFLGLRNLTIIENCLQGIQKRGAKRPDMAALPLDDPKTYQLLQRGDVSGVFQVESGGMREFVIRMAPERFEEIIAVIALFRPGPLDAGMAESFINRKKGREKVVYPHPDLHDVLADTFGVIVYQEQIMQISRVIGGFTPGEADALRKAMGKKKEDQMAKMKEKFLAGARERGYDVNFANSYYDQMAEFAKYGFNKSHSAAYAFIVYQTAWLKANYPTDYMRAVLDAELGKIDQLVPYINTCREMGIEIMGPDINESEHRFTYIQEGVLRFGMGALKGVGAGAVEAILASRQNLAGGKFKSFFHFTEEVNLKEMNKRTLEALIHAGAFQSLGYTRKTLKASLEMAWSHGQKSQVDKESGQFNLFAGVQNSVSLNDPIPKKEDSLEYSQEELLQLEKEVMGFYFSGHPMDKYRRILEKVHVHTIQMLNQCKHKQNVELACLIQSYQIKLTRKNQEMGRLMLEDMTGSIEATLFPRDYVRNKEQLVSDQPMLIKATVERKDETNTISLLVQSMEPLTQDKLDEKQEKSLHVRFRGGAIQPDSIHKIKHIVQNHRGNLQLFFHLNAGNGTMQEQAMVIKAHDSFRVNYTEELRQHLGGIEQIESIYLTIGDRIARLHP